MRVWSNPESLLPVANVTNRLLTVLTGIIAGAVTVLLTAVVLYVLLGRLGDDVGTAWAGRIAVVATGVTVVALAAAFLGDFTKSSKHLPDER